MEDPWGSPWAADAPAKLDLPAAPESAHFSIDHRPGRNNSPRRLSRTPSRAPSPGQSPWGEDDAWGGWNDGSSGKASPAWRASPALRPRADSATKQVLPDPWTKPDVHDILLRRDEETKGLERESDATADSAISVGEGYGKPIEEPQEVWGSRDTMPSRPRPTIPIVQEPDRPDSPDLPPRLAIGSESRASSSRQSSKVRELVQMYDGITERRASPVPSPVEGTAKVLGSGQPQEDDDEDDRDDGEKDSEDGEEDSEDGEEDSEDDGESANAVATVATGDSSTEDATETISSTQPEDSTQNALPLAQELAPAAPDDRPEPVQTPDDCPEEVKSRTRGPSIPYPIDLSGLDELFPSTSSVSTDPEPIPDVIIDNSFRSISERKAWYRISREGSMRKHNFGDDDSYVRVSWKGSDVRNETVSIVRRWMEEESITGRVVLGRRQGGNGANMFGWDASGPEIEIKELLGRKARHSRVSSLNHKEPETPTSPIGGFGWNSPTPSSPASPAVTIAPPGHRSQDSVPAMRSPLSLDFPGRPMSLDAIVAPRAISPVDPPGTPKAQLPSQLQIDAAAEMDDDDEWGEMVVSPTIKTNGRFDLPPILTESKPRQSIETITKSAVTSSPSAWDSPADVSFNTTTSLSATNQQPSTNVDSAWDLGAWDVGGSDKAPFETKIHATPTVPVEAISTARPSPDIVPPPQPPAVKSAATQAVSPILSPTHDNDNAIFDILRSLPDLSYMLR